MTDVEKLVKTTMEEIEKVLSTKAVVGEPTTIEGVTIIPLVCIGFGFGAGGGSSQEKGEGGGGSGGGAGVKPVAVIFIDEDGARVEPIVGGIAGAIEKLSEAIPRIIRRRREKKKEGE